MIDRATDRDLDRIVLKALRKEPERRYGSAEQFADDLQRWLEGRPVSAMPGSNLYRARKFIKRHVVSVAAAAALVLAVAGGAGATYWQARRTAAQRDIAQARFNDVRELARAMVFDIHDAVRDLPGPPRRAL